MHAQTMMTTTCQQREPSLWGSHRGDSGLLLRRGPRYGRLPSRLLPRQPAVRQRPRQLHPRPDGGNGQRRDHRLRHAHVVAVGLVRDGDGPGEEEHEAAVAKLRVRRLAQRVAPDSK